MKVNFQSHVDGVTFTEKHVCSGIKMKGDEDWVSFSCYYAQICKLCANEKYARKREKLIYSTLLGHILCHR